MHATQDRNGYGRALRVAAAAALMLAASPAGAAFTRVPVGGLARRADAVFRGRVERVECFWEEGVARLYTVATVRVSHPLKGTPAETVQVRASGGARDGLAMIIPGGPRFEMGMELVLFCRRSPRDGQLRVLAQGAGQFVRENGVFSRAAARRESYAEADFIDFVERACAGEDVPPPRAVPPAPAAREERRNAGPRRVSIERPAGTDPADASPAAENGQEDKSPSQKDSAGVGAFLAALAFIAAAAALAALRKKKAAAVFLLLSLGVRAEGYEQIEWSPGVYVSWDISGGEVGWRMFTDATPDTSNEFAAVSAAFQAWEDIPTSEIGFEYLGNPPLEIDELDYENVVFFPTVDPDFDEYTLALTVFWADEITGEMLDADIKFNSVYYTFSALGEGGDQPIEGLIEHEVGHVVGLDHPDDVRTATMYYLYSPTAAVLDQDDIDGATAIYPDATPPAAPLITTDGGAGVGMDFGQPSQDLVLDGTMDDDTWTITVNGSTEGVAPFTPGETSWSYSTRLGSSGDHTFQVIAADATGNESAPDTITVTLNAVAPVITYFSVSDATTGSTELTDSFLVKVGAGLEGSAAAWLVREDPSDPTTVEILDPLPGSFVLSAGQGEHAVYLWAKDGSDNVSTRAEARIVVDSIPPHVLPAALIVDSTRVAVRFSEAVAGADSAGAYSVSGTASVTGAAALDADRAMLTLAGLTAGQPYTVTVSGVTDLTGENAVSAPSNEAYFTAVAAGEAQVERIRLSSRWSTSVTFSEEVLGATDVMNYRVAWDTFEYPEDAPSQADRLGGNTYSVWHTDLYDPLDPVYTTYLLARDITDLAGGLIQYNTPGWYEGLLEVDFSKVDSDQPTIDAFELRSLTDGSASATGMRLVRVDMSESDATGAVIRWLLKEDGTPPVASQMLQADERRPALFELPAVAGAHTVYAWVMDDSQNISPAASAGITLTANSAPTAVADGSPLTGLQPLDVSFTAAGSFDPDGDSLSYAWDFGDDEFASDSGPWHTYTEPGTYDVKLVVSDGFGGFAEDALTVVVDSDLEPPVLDVPEVVLKGRVDSPLVTEVDVSGTPHALVAGGFEAAVPVAIGTNVYAITADDGQNPPTVLNVTVEKPP